MIGSRRKRYREAVAAAGRGVNPNEAVVETQSGLDRLAIWVTGNVGTMKFALVIITWTIIWVGYNVVARLSGLPAFDPLPALVAYLLISNVIQICLMPLIMVGQNMQSRHQEAMAELDFRNHKRALAILDILLESLKDDGKIDPEELKQLEERLES